VTFDVWDTDKDGRVRQNEWMGPRELFDRIDLDRDAAVSRDEVRRYELRVRGEDFVGRFDLDGDGRVTPAEFGGPTGAFRRADRNGDGVITRGDRGQ
jgi:Ca2+-binding EF-hand superfamily protein